MSRLSKKTPNKSGFKIGTSVGLAIIFLIGCLLIFISYSFDSTYSTKAIIHELVLFVGETFIGFGMLTVVMEIHTIQDNYQKVRNNLLLEDPSFIERYNENESNRIIELGIKQKIRLHSNSKADMTAIEKIMSSPNPLFMPYIENTAKKLGEDGFYCIYHHRQINITPINNQEYHINITLDVELENITSDTLNFKQKFEFYYISQKQTESFHLKSLEINQKDCSHLLKVQTSTYQKTGAFISPFLDTVQFFVPIKLKAKSKIHYILNYEYKNYEQACYITYSLPHITKSFQERYSIIGENANDYQLHASAYIPYKNSFHSNNLVQQENDVTLSINFNHWAVPGSGFVAIVRKKMV